MCNPHLPSRHVHSERRLPDRGKHKTKVGHQTDSRSPSQTSRPSLTLQYPPAPPPLGPSPATHRLPPPPRLPSQPRRLPNCLPGTQTTSRLLPHSPIHLMHRRRPPAPLTPPPPPHIRHGPLLLARRPTSATPRRADSHLQPGTTRLRTGQSARPSRMHLQRSRQGGARAAVQARKGQVANARAARPTHQGDTWKKKRKGRDNGGGLLQPAAPPGLRCLRAARPTWL